MSIRNLEFMFQPRSVTVVGASTQLHSVGLTVMRSLLADGFAGPIMPVNPKYKAVAGVLAYPDVKSLPEPPDLAALCTPPPTIPSLIAKPWFFEKGCFIEVDCACDVARNSGCVRW